MIALLLAAAWLKKAESKEVTKMREDEIKEQFKALDDECKRAGIVMAEAGAVRAKFR